MLASFFAAAWFGTWAIGGVSTIAALYTNFQAQGLGALLLFGLALICFIVAVIPLIMLAA